ncbi:choice-of-anchor X domain-containing protein, partial [Candidatus Methanodesulfokora washburnensis]
ILNKSRYNETFFLSVYVAEKSGNYSLICGNASYSFSVYPVNWGFNGSLLRIESPVGGNLTVITCSNTSRVKFNGSISLNISAPALIKIEELNFTLRIPGISIDRNVHFPKERVEICALGNTTVVSPSGRLLINRSIDKPEIVQIWLNQTVELGNYTVKADSEERKFTVDSYSIKARAVGRRIEGNVSYYFVMPHYISYEINGKEGRAAVVNGSFEINATDEGTYQLRCGNAVVNLTRDVKVENGFVNRTIRVNVSFIPVESYLKLGNSSYKLNFTNGTAEFTPRKAGIYTVFVDGIKRSLIVDNYEIRAVLDSNEVRGNVSYLFIPPVDVEYLLLPLNESGKANVVNGSFSFKVGNITAVLLKCGNAELKLDRNSSSALLDGLRLEANGSYISVAKMKGGIYVSVRSHPNFTTVLRVYGLDKELEAVSEDGKELYLRAKFSNGIQEFLLEDGSPNDPDGSANGLFNLILRPKRAGANISLNESKGKEIKQYTKPEEVKEILASGSGKKWRIKFYKLDKIENFTGMVQLKNGLFVKEEQIGEAEEIKVRSRLIADGKILVELEEKSGWVRISVELPKGALVKEVLADDQNGTRVIDSWYQSGNKLIFYDDPNRYYYILYGVPPWWDPDGVAQGYDWHYRVPLQLPTLRKDHTIWLDVNFNYLLSLLNVTGTFDPNSVRVVDDQGNLVPKQEFVPLGSGIGRVKFILHKDLGSPSTFYIYFDITENGAKPYLNTLNAGLDSGTLNYWTYGKNPSTISSIIQASPPGPYTVYDPYGTPNYVTDDGNPVFGGYSLVLGYRTPSGSEDATSTGEDTWAYYEFTVPADGGMLYFWYRVESWGSANYDYFRAELRNTAGDTLATIVNNYNPNLGYNYGNFSDSGWRSVSFDLSSYAGQTVRAYFLVHTYWDPYYKTWAYIDNLTWAPVNLTSSLVSSMVEGFGLNVTSPKGTLSYGPVRVEAKVDAKPSRVIARIYNPLGALVTTAQLYDDGTNGDTVPNDGIYTNANAYTLSSGSPFGKWRIIVLANDSSTSIYPGYSGLIHIPGRPYEVNYTDFFNVDETYFYFGPVKGTVFEDREPLATYGSEDSPMSNVLVYALKDNGDGIFNPLDDALFTWGKTDSSGYYTFSIQNGRYFVVVNSKNLTAGLNSGHSIDETWAEQTYQVEWNGSAYVGKAKYGGIDPTVSDSCLSLVFRDDFEVWQGWNNYRLGRVAQSNAEFYNGNYSLVRDANNDPNGGYKLIGTTIGRGYILQGYAFRPTPIGPRGRDSVSLVDSNYNGYGFIVDHRNNRIQVVRRINGDANVISTVNYDPPDESWYFWKLILLTNNTIIFRLYDTDGNLLAQVSGTDTNYNSFDRVLVQGDATYYIDTLALWRIPDRCEHITMIDTSNYMGESLDFGFSYEIIVNTRDADDDPGPRTCQGCLRQFIMNSNAIKGMQKSYFLIPKSDPNYVQESLGSSLIDAWRIKLSSSLPQITDDVNLTAKTQSGARGFIEGKYVGLDNHRIQDFETPRIEIDGNGYDVFYAITKKSQIEGFSIYNARHAIAVRGSNSIHTIRDNFIGTYANGSNSFKAIFGIQVGEYSDSIIDRNLSAFIRHNIVALSDMYGIVVNSGNIANATIEDNWVRECGASYKIGDGISLQTNGNKVVHNFVERNRNDGSTSRIDGGAGVELVVWVPEQSYGLNLVLNNTIVNNSRWGVSVLSLYTKALLEGNIISGNQIGVIVSDTSVANITSNSIFNNSRVGIDLDISGNTNGDDVSLNDGTLSGSQPNKGMDYPVITSATLSGGILQLKGYVGTGPSSTFANSIIDIYLVRNSTKGDNLTGNNLSGGKTLPDNYGEGWIWLGRLVADGNGNFEGAVNAPQVDCNSLITATATLNGTSEFGPDFHPVCRRNVSASIKIAGDSAILNVTAHELKQYNIIAYWVKPQNIDITSMSGDYDAYGSNGNVYWWKFNQIDAEKTKHVYLSLSFSGDYSLMNAFNVGVDPPSTDKGLKIDVKEFSSIIFYPNGSYSVRELWGFLTLNNTSPDIISDISIYINGTGYTFYPDYPNASSSPVYPPLHLPLLLPGSYARWRYTAPKGEAFVPLRFIERNMSCGALISIQALDDVENVVIRKMGLIYTVGNIRKGEIRNITLNFSFSGCVQQNATVEFSYKNASLLKKINRIRALGPAEIQIRKEVQGNKTKVAAYMRNTASSLVYRLDKICIMRSESGPILLCESPSKVLGPGELYETEEFSENITGIPKYYANATFTMLPSINGVTVPLQNITSVYYIAAAVLVEPVICCTPAPSAPAPPPPVPPAPPTPAVNVTPAAPAANVTANITAKPVMVPIISIFKSADKYRAYVGDIVRFTITVRNSGNGTWEGDVTDSLPGELRYAGASSARGNVTGPSVSGGTLSWHVVLSPGHEASISYQAVVASYPSSGYVENLAVAAGFRSSAYIEIVKPIRVADIRKAGELSGREIIYVISVVSTNYEGSLTVVDYLPGGLSYIPGATLDGSPYEPAVQGNKLTWSIYIGKNQTRVIKFSAHIEKVYGVDVVNTA